MLRTRSIALLSAALCGAGVLAAASGSTPAGAAPTAHVRAAKKTCRFTFVVKGGAGETHAKVNYSFGASNVAGAGFSPDAKLPYRYSTGRLACGDDVNATDSAHNYSSGRGDTYVYVYLNGRLVGSGFGAGDGSSARATFSLS